MDKNEREPTQVQRIDVNRRRLTKAGLAVPAVLGTLASRPVLANVAWKCTVSGNTSGNDSGHESESCASLGDGQSVWADHFSKGDAKKTLISDLFPKLDTNYFFMTDESSHATLTDFEDTKLVATIYQVLSLKAPAGLEYAQKALVLLLNANDIADTTIYPLTEYQATNLYIAAATESSFSDTNPAITWDYKKVKDYIDLLWEP